MSAVKSWTYSVNVSGMKIRSFSEKFQSRMCFHNVLEKKLGFNNDNLKIVPPNIERFFLHHLLL